MWPQILDLSKDECKKILRRLELEAYYSIITAFRAQGDLTKEKKKVLQDLCNLLGISTERHRAEIRRAVNDEKLNTIADQITGCSKSSEWAIEGRRLVPLMPRLVPQTVFTAFANNAANMAAAQNAAMPPPSATSNKQENIHAANDVEITSLKSAYGNKSVNLVKPNLSSHTSQTCSSVLLPSEIEQSESLDNFAEEVENHVFSIQESRATDALSGNMEGISDDKNVRRKRSSSVDTPKVAIPTKSSAVQRTLNLPMGSSPVQVTGTVTTTGQKVILVSTSCSNLPSSILQRTLGGQVKAVSTMTSASQTQSKSPLVASIASNISNTSMSASPCPPRQKGKIAAVPGTSQPSTASAHTQTLQIRSGTPLTKPTFHFKDGSGLKIIAQAVPMSSGGTKIISKPSSSGSSSPIVVVTKTGSLPPGIQSGTRVVNVITTQASSGKMIMPTAFSVAKSAGSPALVTVGPKGRQTALVKVAPTMSLTSQGGKPNLFVVQKAHLSSLASGNAVPLPASVTACAQTVLRQNSDNSQDDKTNQMERKSTVLADLLQAAGILPDGSSADIQAMEITEHADSGEGSKVEDEEQTQAIDAPTADKQFIVVGDQRMAEEEQPQKQQQVLQASVDELSRTSSNSELILPFTVQDSSTLEIQDHSNGEQATKLSTTIDLMKQAGLNIGSKPADKGKANVEGSSTSSYNANLEGCQMPCSSIQTLPGENGELDPTTGIFYPYRTARQSDTNSDEPNSFGTSQILQQPVTTAGDVQLDLPVIKIEAEQTGSIVAPQNITKNIGVLDVDIKPDVDLKSFVTSVNTDYVPHVALKREIDTGDNKAGGTSEFLNDGKSSVVAMKTEIGSMSSEIPEARAVVKIPELAPANSSQSLYRGVTYSKEDAVARKKTMQSDSLKTENAVIKPSDDLRELPASSPPSEIPIQEVVYPEDGCSVTEHEVVEEILECEEVHFTDDNIITTIIEETVVTTDEAEHYAIMDPDAVELIEDGNKSSENAPVEQCLPSCEQDGESLACQPTVEFEPVAYPTVQVSIKDVLANSKSQSSGSSIFMVTDSVVETDPMNLPLVESLPDDIVAVEQIEVSEAEEGSDVIPVAEVTVHDDGSTSYVVRQQDDIDSTFGSSKIPVQLVSIKEERDIASTSYTGIDRDTGKRKRKPSTLRASAIEESSASMHLSGWTRAAMGLLLRVMKFRGSKRMKGGPSAAHWFIHPVTEAEAPGYHQVVKYPMDFSTVKKKLETGCYQDVSEFNQDMNLVKINCETYNPPQHEARLDCEEVFIFYDQEYDKLVEKWQKTQSLPSSQKKLKFS